jgi:hypothetical protein
MDMVVTESDDGLTMTVKTDKRINTFKIHKSNDGFAFFQISYEGSGQVPEELQSYYTSRQDALRALKYWNEHATPTKEKEWEDKYKDTITPELKVKKNAAKVQSEAS